MRVQQEKLDHDYEYNHKLHQVLRFTTTGPSFIHVPRYQLRTGDLVLCDESINLDCVPISGELVALHRNGDRDFTRTLEQKNLASILKHKMVKMFGSSITPNPILPPITKKWTYMQ